VTARSFRLDLALLREGIEVGWEFGAHSLVELARVAEYIEREVYTAGSLVGGPGGLKFRLGNPPLRLGAFHRLVVSVDGVIVPPRSATVSVGGGAPRALDSVSRSEPVELLPGRGAAFTVRPETPVPVGALTTVRLELHNVAIPPRVWLEIRDRVRPEPTP
jgi:hypothetical protein